MISPTVGIVVMCAWGVCGILCTMASKQGSVREASSILMAVIGFGFMFVLIALKDLPVGG